MDDGSFPSSFDMIGNVNNTGPFRANSYSGLNLNGMIAKETAKQNDKISVIQDKIDQNTKVINDLFYFYNAFYDMQNELISLETSLADRQGESVEQDFFTIDVSQDADLLSFIVSHAELATTSYVNTQSFPSSFTFQSNGRVVLVRNTIVPETVARDKSYSVSGRVRGRALDSGAGITNLKVNNDSLLGRFGYKHFDLLANISDGKFHSTLVLDGEKYEGTPLAIDVGLYLIPKQDITFSGSGGEFTVRIANRYTSYRSLESNMIYDLGGSGMWEDLYLRSTNDIEYAHAQGIGSAADITVESVESTSTRLIFTVNGEEYVLNTRYINTLKDDITLIDSNGKTFIIGLKSDIDISSSNKKAALKDFFKKAFFIADSNADQVVVPVKKGDTLEDFVLKLNDTGLVNAYILRSSETEKKLIVRSVEEGKTNGYILVDIANMLNINDSIIGKDSKVTIDNTEISFSSNEIEVIPDTLYLSLKKDLLQERDPPLPFRIHYDSAKIVKFIGDFIDTYNDIQDKIAVQRKRDAYGKLTTESTIYYNNVFQDLVLSLSRVMDFTLEEKSLFDLGVSTSKDGKLSFDVENFINMSQDEGLTNFVHRFVSSFLTVSMQLLSPSSSLRKELSNVVTISEDKIREANVLSDELARKTQSLIRKYSQLDAKIAVADYIKQLLSMQLQEFTNK